MPGDNGSYEVSYYEVGDRRLARAGASLSRRVENGRGVWRLELPGLNGEPLGLEQAGGPVSPPARIGRVLPAFLRGAEPTQVARVRLRGESVEVLEGELPESDDQPADDPIGTIRAMLGRQYAEILRHDPGIRLDIDPEDVHRLRVAVRRARAVLRAARRVLDPEWSEPLRAELKWLGGSFGPQRDLDVLLARLRSQVAELDEPERTAAETLVVSLEAEREGAQALASEALASDRYFGLLDSLEAAVRGPRVRRGEVSLTKLAAREFDRLLWDRPEM